jgi:hypothetical protein
MQEASRRRDDAAALCLALAHDRFETALRFAVRLGGDTDTVAAMAGAVAGARDGYHAIPAGWVEPSKMATAAARTSSPQHPSLPYPQHVAVVKPPRCVPNVYRILKRV